MPLPGRRHGGGGPAAEPGNPEWAGAGQCTIEIEMAFRQRGEPIEERSQIGMFAGLNETEMTLRSASAASRGTAPSTGMPTAAMASATSARWRSLATRLRMTPADAHGRIVDGETTQPPAAADCACRATSSTSTTGRPKCAARSAVAPRRPGLGGGSVEQAHDAFDDEQVCTVDRSGGHGVEQCRRHGPGIQIDARSARGSGVKRRIDVIGPGLGGADHDAAPDERGQYGKRHGGLAGTRIPAPR